MECAKLKTCIFFNDQMDAMPAVSAVLKKQFCEGTFADCARFRVATALGATGVPTDLFPTDSDRADRLLAARN